MKKNKWKQLFNWVGLGIGIIGIVFVVRKLSEYSNQIDFSCLTSLSLFSLLGLSLVYCFSNLFLAFAWRDILQYLGIRTNKKWAVQTNGISQIAKYVPGNIFQFAGRQAIGQAEGLPALPLAKSAVWEIGLLAFTGALFSVLVIPLFLYQITYLVALILFIIVIVFSVLCVNYWIGASVASAMRWDVLFLIIAGIIFNGVLLIVTPGQPTFRTIFIGMTGVYVVAWLAGLVTPGAPAGIGVREMVFLAILHGVVNEGELLKAIVLGRFVTIGGDVLFYVFSLVLRFSLKNRKLN